MPSLEPSQKRVLLTHMAMGTSPPHGQRAPQSGTAPPNRPEQQRFGFLPPCWVQTCLHTLILCLCTPCPEIKSSAPHIHAHTQKKCKKCNSFKSFQQTKQRQQAGYLLATFQSSPTGRYCCCWFLQPARKAPGLERRSGCRPAHPTAKPRAGKISLTLTGFICQRVSRVEEKEKRAKSSNLQRSHRNPRLPAGVGARRGISRALKETRG